MSAADPPEWVLLEGDNIPPHLRRGATRVGVCGRCGRKVPESQINTEDRMTQPDGYPCGGRFEPGVSLLGGDR